MATVLISGGSRGLGVAIAKHLLAEGFRVVAFSRRANSEVAELEKGWEDEFFFYEADLSDRNAMRELVDFVEDEHGALAGLVNNAGIALDGLLAMTPDDDIERLIRVNLLGPLTLTRAVAKRMLMRQHGSIVTITSIVGLRGYSGLSGYSATKAGLDGMTRALARELGSRNVRVNSVAPGFLETEMTHGLDDEQRRQIVRRTPLGRLGTVQDVTGVVAFLLSDQGAFMTGQTLVVDGGITC
jgi:3-oxoacyl-[acyl-carrier protein] reductase